jgi:hypothetical protein
MDMVTEKIRRLIVFEIRDSLGFSSRRPHANYLFHRISGGLGRLVVLNWLRAAHPR